MRSGASTRFAAIESRACGSLVLRYLLGIRSIPLVTLLLLICAAILSADTASPCSFSYFSDGSVASSRCRTDGGASETVRFFDQRGEPIGTWTLLPRMSGISISFHPNGMVRRVRYSHQPDGGIQWYRSTTLFDKNGNITHFSEDAWNMHERIMSDPRG